jgi:hypothetical protein
MLSDGLTLWSVLPFYLLIISLALLAGSVIAVKKLAPLDGVAFCLGALPVVVLAMAVLSSDGFHRGKLVVKFVKGEFLFVGVLLVIHSFIGALKKYGKR